MTDKSQGNYLEKRFRTSDTVVSRKIADEFILVPIQSKSGDLDFIYTLNEVGGRIWELIDGQNQLIDIRNKIIKEFEIGPDQADADIIEFLEQLEQIKAVNEV